MNNQFTTTSNKSISEAEIDLLSFEVALMLKNRQRVKK